MTSVENGTVSRQEEAANWFVTLNAGELDGNRLLEFEEWLAVPRNQAAFDAVRETWGAAGVLSEREEILNLRAGALNTGENGTAIGLTHHGWWKRGWLTATAIAASIALLFVIIPRDDASNIYTTEPGQLLTVTLDDGSVVELDSSTRLAVNFDEDRRSISLIEGRANFEVAKDYLRPFSVAAGDKVFVAKGTEFSVELVNGQVHAVLYEGRVAVMPQDTGSANLMLERPRQGGSATDVTRDELIMVEGDAFVAPSLGELGASAISKPEDIELTAQWREGRLDFDNETLLVAVARMNRYARMKIEIDLPDAEDIRVSGNFAAGQAEPFAEGVARLNRLELRRENGKLILSR